MSEEADRDTGLDAMDGKLRGLAWLLLVLGVAGFMGLRFVNGQRQTRPVYLQIPDTADTSAEAVYTPSHSGVYEVEVELRHPAPRETFKDYIQTTKDGAFPCTWTSEQNGERAGEGSLATYLYLSMTGPMRRRARQWVGLEQYRDIGVARMSRGVGRFKVDEDVPVKIVVSASRDLDPAVVQGQPHLVIRLNRKLSETYLSQSLVLAGLCALMITTSGALFVFRFFRRRPRA